MRWKQTSTLWVNIPILDTSRGQLQQRWELGGAGAVLPRLPPPKHLNEASAHFTPWGNVIPTRAKKVLCNLSG